MLFLTPVSYGSIAVWEISVFKSIKNSNSARSSVTFVFVFNFPMMMISLLFRSYCILLHPQLVDCCPAYSHCLLRFWQSLVQFHLPPVFLPALLFLRILLLVDNRICWLSGSVPHQYRQSTLYAVYSVGMVQKPFFVIGGLLVSGLLFRLMIMSNISRMAPQR